VLLSCPPNRPKEIEMPPPLPHRALPPLNALKGFESAARLGSFRKAADELNVTHVAISHQVKALENDMHCQLFRREGRSVALTEDGKLFYEYTRQALELLITGAQAMRRDTPDAELRIETYVTVAIRWLSHRLPRFRANHPDISYSINTRRTQWWFDEANTDLAIVHLDRDLPPNLRQKKLFDATLYPVCSPTFLEGFPPVNKPEDLLAMPLIEVSSAPGDWRNWFAAAGVAKPEMTRVQKVDTYALALELAIEGNGVVMLNGPFAEAELRQRRLVLPFDFVASAPGHWAAVYRADRANDARTRAFLNWLISEVTPV